MPRRSRTLSLSSWITAPQTKAWSRREAIARDNFTLIENGENTGFSHAVNQGIQLAKGEYVVLFNNDAFAEPDWLSELIRTAERDEKIFAVQSLR